MSTEVLLRSDSKQTFNKTEISFNSIKISLLPYISFYKYDAQNATLLTITCSKSTVETLEHALRMFKVNNKT